MMKMPLMPAEALKPEGRIHPQSANHSVRVNSARYAALSSIVIAIWLHTRGAWLYSAALVLLNNDSILYIPILICFTSTFLAIEQLTWIEMLHSPEVNRPQGTGPHVTFTRAPVHTWHVPEHLLTRDIYQGTCTHVALTSAPAHTWHLPGHLYTRGTFSLYTSSPWYKQNVMTTNYLYVYTKGKRWRHGQLSHDTLYFTWWLQTNLCRPPFCHVFELDFKRKR